MNIQHFIDFINKRRGWDLQGAYYSNITAWRDWWKGDVPKWSVVNVLGYDGCTHPRPRASLHMIKRACEDWATLLLNEKTTVTVADAAASHWLCGDTEAQQTGGELGRLGFWQNANALVELAMRSGTGAFVLGAENLRVENGRAAPDANSRLTLDYLPAECILPVTVRRGRVTEAAFVSEVQVKGEPRIFLQTHTLTADGGYRIENEYFTGEETDSEHTTFKEAPLPDGVHASFLTGGSVPWFSLFSPAIVKNIDGGSGLGMAVFAEALDAARQVDRAFDNYCQDIALGGKKVFYTQRLLRSWIDTSGKEHYAAPDADLQQLFVQPDGADPDHPDWHEYNPDLRAADNGTAVQDALDYFSFRCGLGAHRYQFSQDSVKTKTATEYMGERQDMVQHANRHQIQIEAALLDIFRAMLWAGKNLCGVPLDENTALTVNFDDSYIVDTETRRAQMRDDAVQGFLPKYKYVMEYYGMSKEDAKALVNEASAESAAAGLSFGEE